MTSSTAAVLQCQSEIDRLQNRFGQRRAASGDDHVASLANWLKEAGDLAKALAEVICHFATGNKVFQV